MNCLPRIFLVVIVTTDQWKAVFTTFLNFITQDIKFCRYTLVNLSKHIAVNMKKNAYNHS